MASQNNGRANEELLSDSRGQVTMLDRALEGATVEHKARVRGLLVSYGIEQDNEFYMLFVAFGHLTVLVEEAPENWAALFDDIYQELNQWSNQNLKSLESLKLHTQTSAELIQSLRLLLNSIKTSDDRSSKMLSTLSSLELRLMRIDNSSASMANHSSQTLEKVSSLESLLEKLDSQGNRKDWISTFNTAFSLATAGLLTIVGITLSRQLDTQTQLIQRQDREIGWLLDKANRAECVNGIKPPSDPQCQQFQ